MRSVVLGAQAYFLDVEGEAEAIDVGISATLCDGAATWRATLLPCNYTPPRGVPTDVFHARLLDGLTIGPSSGLSLTRSADASMELLWNANITEDLELEFSRRHSQRIPLQSADTQKRPGVVEILGALAEKCSTLQEECERKRREAEAFSTPAGGRLQQE